MNLNPKQQTKKLIENSQNILVLTPVIVDGDSLGSGLALARAFTKMGKKVTVICPGDVPENLKFLPELSMLQRTFEGSRDFVISIDCVNAEVDKLKYNLEGNKLNIIVTPKSGSFQEQDVSFTQSMPSVDLVFVVDSSNLELIGPAYTDNIDFFYETPIVNIDHHASNEYFGKVNLIDITATSTCEIVLSLLESLDPSNAIMDEHIATLLLTGVITDTGSFQHANTTPKAFSVAAQLLAHGARQQEIVKHVFKTRELSTLKLWGRTLTHIQFDPKHRLVWAAVSKKDFEETGAKEEEISGLIDHLMSSVPEADTILLLKESDQLVKASLRSTTKNVDVAKMAEIFGGGGHRRASGFRIPYTNFAETEEQILTKIREFLEHQGKGDEPEVTHP